MSAALDMWVMDVPAPSPRPGEPHVPVMAARVVELLVPDPGARGVLVDATVGAGGHAAALLAATGPGVRVVGLDRDTDALALAEERLAPFGDRVTLVHDGYDRVAAHLAAAAAEQPLLGVLYDLGVSSMQLDRPERGFSFRTDAPLDMRMDASSGATAADLVNTLDAAQLTRILATYGEERRARRIVRAIERARPITTTTALAEVVTAAYPPAARHTGTHPATRTFQALRIAVNAELDRFSASLPQALRLVAPRPVPGAVRAGDRGGRVAVLAYHSLEDRIAKATFADAAHGCICPPDLPVCGCGREAWARLVTHGAEQAGPDEVAENPRARSVRLRVAEVVAPPPERPVAGEAG